jgi:CBS domain-containing protein
MIVGVGSVKSDESLSNAAWHMWDCDRGAIPVVDGSTDHVVGMITDRDICMATWTKDRAPSTIPISNAMSRSLFHCGPEDDVSLADELMRAKQIRRIPVLDRDLKLVGILSLADIVTRSQRAGTRPAASELAPTEITATLANICEPWPTRSQSATV